MEKDYLGKTTISATGHQQTINNSTGWVGHFPGQKDDISVGQTFVAPTKGHLQAIEIFPNAVAHAGHVKVSLHTYNPELKQWGDAIDTANVKIDNANEGEWIAIPVHQPSLEAGKAYGFKIESNDTLVGIGEAASSAIESLHNGGEWVFKPNETAKLYNYFSLAYKLKMSA